MLIYTQLSSYGSSTVLSSPLLSFWNTTLSSPLLLLLPSVPAHEPTRLAADVAYGAEAKGLVSRPCSRCATIGECGKRSSGRRMVRWRWGLCAQRRAPWWLGGSACHKWSNQKNDFATRSNARWNIRSYRLQQREIYDKNNIIWSPEILTKNAFLQEQTEMFHAITFDQNSFFPIRGRLCNPAIETTDNN